MWIPIVLAAACSFTCVPGAFILHHLLQEVLKAALEGYMSGKELQCYNIVRIPKISLSSDFPKCKLFEVFSPLSYKYFGLVIVEGRI